MKAGDEGTASAADAAIITYRNHRPGSSIEILTFHDARQSILCDSNTFTAPGSVEDLLLHETDGALLPSLFSRLKFEQLPSWFEIEPTGSNETYSISAVPCPESDRIMITIRNISSSGTLSRFNETIIRSEFDFIGVADEEGVITDILFDSTGIILPGRNGFIGKTIRELYGQAFAEPLMNLIRAVQDTDKPASMFYHSPFKGDLRRYKITCSGMVHQGNNQFIFTVKDITTNLSFSTPLNDTLFLGMITHDTEGRILNLSPHFVRASGIPEEEVLGKPVTSILSKFRGEREFDAAIVTRKGEVITSKVYTTLSKTNSGEPCLISSLLNTGEILKSQRLLERKISFENILFDLSSSVFRSTEETLDADIDHALEMLGTFSGADRSYVFLYREEGTMDNTHEWAAHGITREKENLQQLPTDVFPNWVRALGEGKDLYVRDVKEMDYTYAAEREILTAQSIRSVYEVPLQAHGKNFGFMGFDAVRSTMEWSTEERQLLRYFANNLAEVLARNEYIKELVDLKIEAESLAIERESSNRDLSIFFAKVSHEIRNSINSILGMTHMLLDTQLTDQQKRYSEVIRSGSTFLIELVKDILDFSKINNSEVEFRETTFSLKSLITHAVDSHTQDANRKYLHITSSTSPDIPPYLIGDPVRINQMLSNLLGNAIKFTEKGNITITAVCSSISGQTVNVEISVTDTGRGIPGKEIKNLFTPFYSTGQNTGKLLHSSGLGLPIVKSLAESMQGEVSVKSTLGEGSTFSIILPLRIGGAVTPGGTFDRSWQGAKVIVIDSNPVSADNSSQILKSLSFSTDVLTDKEEFENFLCKVEQEGHPYALCFMDISLLDSEILSRLRTCKSTGKHISHQMVLTSSDPDAYSYLDDSLSLFDARFTLPLDAQMVVSLINSTGEKLRENLPFDYHTFSILSPLHILIVEDIEINQEILAYMLNQVGASYTIASSGQEAVNLVKEKSFDVILLDIIMPGMNGYETAKIIRGLDSTSNARIPIVAVTAKATYEERERCLLAGMNDYLVKPIQKEELYGVLLQFLPSQPDTGRWEQSMDEAAQGPISIEEFNVSKGLSLLQHNTGVYLKLIRKFYEGYRDYQNLYREASMSPEAAMRFVHSVKSIASSLGAENLSTIASVLETSLDSDDQRDLEKMEQAFISSLGKAIEAIHRSPYCGVPKQEKEKLIPKDTVLIPLLEAFINGCSIGDAARIRHTLERLNSYRHSEERSAEIDSIAALVRAYNYSEAENIARTLLSELGPEGGTS